MIRYQLECHKGHAFEGWFRSSDDYEAQRKARRVECVVCGTARVKKALMAPALGRSPSQVASAAPTPDQGKSARRAQYFAAVRAHVEANFENVGERFPEEARAIHKGESEERGIYGEASADEVKSLLEEGVSIAPLPPSDRNIN